MNVLIDLRLRSPLCIARRPTAPGQPVETLRYISGTVLRGGLAHAWLQGRRYNDISSAEKEEFQSLFLHPALQFGNCWPLYLPTGEGNGEIRNVVAAEVIPRTCYAGKYDGNGWLADGGDGVTDQLHRFLQAQEICDTLDRFDDMFAVYDDHRYYGMKVRKRSLTRTAIDPTRGTARESLLYTLEALETGQWFRGRISGSADALQQLRKRVCHEGDILAMGQGRSRGLGEVVLERVCEVSQTGTDEQRTQLVSALETVVDTSEVPRPNDEHGVLVQAIECFNHRVGYDQDTVLLPVTLESDVLLRDYYLLPSSDPQPATTLGRYIPLPPPLDRTMTLDEQGLVQATHWIGGWDELRRIPRPPQLAVSLGSVWTFRVPREHLGLAVTWWIAAQQQGIGERRNEGYGRVRLCHPLHILEGEQ